eukprot:TRINITY_DN15505_c0_g1_i1.p2 TRINITY_DN15505_c0_g1~~TRINITY_DN15505_c0_g1_i1.p2  ORF type:complete len:105 (+),score=5.14 TRINITY_DN15505_c0_g1_i1:74-388(+)
MMRRPPRSTLSSSSAASDVYKRQSKYRCPKRRWNKHATRHSHGFLPFRANPCVAGPPARLLLTKHPADYEQTLHAFGCPRCDAASHTTGGAAHGEFAVDATAEQ